MDWAGSVDGVTMCRCSRCKVILYAFTSSCPPMPRCQPPANQTPVAWSLIYGAAEFPGKPRPWTQLGPNGISVRVAQMQIPTRGLSW